MQKRYVCNIILTLPLACSSLFSFSLAGLSKPSLCLRSQQYYCMVEYATPLLTLYQMSHDSTAGFSEQDRRQQVLLFYRTLNQILECSLECRNRYRLILLEGVLL